MAWQQTNYSGTVKLVYWALHNDWGGEAKLDDKHIMHGDWLHYWQSIWASIIGNRSAMTGGAANMKYTDPFPYKYKSLIVEF